MGRALAIASSILAVVPVLLLLATSQERAPRSGEVFGDAKAAAPCCRVFNVLYDTGEWEPANKLDNAGRDVEVRELIANVVEIAITRDRLGTSHLLCFEALERMKQWGEESCQQELGEDRLMEFGSGKDPDAITADALAGQLRMLGHSVVVPELISHVVGKAAADLQILEQPSKALEARELAHRGQESKK